MKPAADARNGAGPDAGMLADPRQTRPRPDRPKFEITCAQCAAVSHVPFKPLEGREVFCQDCYRARRAIPREERDKVEAIEVNGSDAGIVE